jgi:hypothetical protein
VRFVLTVAVSTLVVVLDADRRGYYKSDFLGRPWVSEKAFNSQSSYSQNRNLLSSSEQKEAMMIQ